MNNPPGFAGRRLHPKFKLDKPMNIAAMGGFPTPFANFSKFVDPSGKLNFNGKAVLHASGVDFTNGNSYKINMKELTLLEELGKGQYGTVQKVHHIPTNVTMAMKEIRLELDQTKLNQIMMEVDILQKAQSPHIVEFYGAFFIESCVYLCMEYMDASLDKLYGDGVPEPVLGKITWAVVNGLKTLKDEHSIIHRDVKPTNVLVNTKGDVKLCDFGVSGQLEQSMAKTNIGCQSYMAPERITTATASTYTVQSDIWSLGLSLVELALGRYPYGGGKFDSVLAQINAIVQGEPPQLPEDKYSQECRDFVAQCLNKDPRARPNYAQLLDSPWLRRVETEQVDVGAWVREAIAQKNARATNAINQANAEYEARLANNCKVNGIGSSPVRSSTTARPDTDITVTSLMMALPKTQDSIVQPPAVKIEGATPTA